MFTLTLRFVTFMMLNFKKELFLTEQFLRRLSKLQVPLFTRYEQDLWCSQKFTLKGVDFKFWWSKFLKFY